MAGAFNSSVLKVADKLLNKREGEFERVGLTLLGKKAADHFRRRRGDQITFDSPIDGDVTYEQAADVARELVTPLCGWANSTRSCAHLQRIQVDDDADAGGDAATAVYATGIRTIRNRGTRGEEALPFEIEPDPRGAARRRWFRRPIEIEVFRALLENQAGEHAARMTAMESATRNTEELIESAHASIQPRAAGRDHQRIGGNRDRRSGLGITGSRVPRPR